MTIRRRSPQFEAKAPKRDRQGLYYGAGDVVALVTTSLGVKPCAGCERRRAMLNALLPQVLRRRKQP